MHHDAKLQDKLVKYIEDAYSMENQLVEALEKQVSLTSEFPTIQVRIRQHLAETEQHRQRMEARLAAYNKKPSAVKGALSAFMGTTQGFVSGTRADPLAMAVRDDYMIEHLAIGSYTMLITIARAFGDEETVRACELNLRDEVEMQAWLAQHLPEATLRSLEKDGITIPRTAWALAQAAQAAGIHGMFTTPDTRATQAPI